MKLAIAIAEYSKVGATNLVKSAELILDDIDIEVLAGQLKPRPETLFATNRRQHYQQARLGVSHLFTVS